MVELQLYTRKRIETLINQGHLIIILNNNVLKLDNWARFHPGGILPISHMVGKDATDPVSVSHSPEVLKSMSKFRIGRINEPWIDIEPPISRTNDTQTVKSDISSASSFVKDGRKLRVTGKQTADHLQAIEQELPTPPASKWLVGRSTASRLQADGDRHGREEALAHLRQHEIDIDLDEFPSVDADTQRAISARFQELHKSVREQGLYTCKMSNYMKEITRYSILFASFVMTFRQGWYLVSAVCLGLFWHQIMFSAHDAGHLAITHNFKADTAIGIFIADFCCGLSIGWWKSSHNVHHLVPNHIEHDPDIQNVPLFATSALFCKSLRSTYYGSIFPWDAAAAVMTRIQKYTYYPVMCLARFNLYALSWGYLISEKANRLPASVWTRPLEILGMLCYWYWFGYYVVWCSIPTWPLRIGFVLISHIATMPLHVQITLSHWGMSTADLGSLESFAQKQLRTTMDVDCPAWLDWIHGGLQFQAVHHLFPRVPRHNLREAQALVKQFCKEQGLKYTIFGFMEGNKVVLGRLGEITNQLDILVRCQNDMSKGLVHHHH